MAGTRPAMTILDVSKVLAHHDELQFVIGFPLSIPSIVMAGLVPAIHGFLFLFQHPALTLPPP
jgi:hypothetical protein